MAMRVQDNKLAAIIELLSEQGLEGMGEAVKILINEAMLIERNRHLQADPYERTSERQGVSTVSGLFPPLFN